MIMDLGILCGGRIIEDREAARAVEVFGLAFVVEFGRTGLRTVLEADLSAETGDEATRQVHANSTTLRAKLGGACGRIVTERHLRIGAPVAAAAFDLERSGPGRGIVFEADGGPGVSFKVTLRHRRAHDSRVAAAKLIVRVARIGTGHVGGSSKRQRRRVEVPGEIVAAGRFQKNRLGVARKLDDAHAGYFRLGLRFESQRVRGRIDRERDGAQKHVSGASGFVLDIHVGLRAGAKRDAVSAVRGLPAGPVLRGRPKIVGAEAGPREARGCDRDVPAHVAHRSALEGHRHVDGLPIGTSWLHEGVIKGVVDMTARRAAGVRRRRIELRRVAAVGAGGLSAVPVDIVAHHRHGPLTLGKIQKPRAVRAESDKLVVDGRQAGDFVIGVERAVAKHAIAAVLSKAVGKTQTVPDLVQRTS